MKAATLAQMIRDVASGLEVSGVPEDDRIADAFRRLAERVDGVEEEAEDL